ncbi:prepilin-type N-terminal cleavage/methylation domain-containing protein [Halomonas sp. CS7]|uniref:Prepilin-type N-terminal cleavage/methylation domain-containing protein n=1 Tax=Halomonas pelophila TaxID=3151122 RepID=A0ABV1N7I0_9GAMM
MRSKRSYYHESGFTLVELMVALVLGLLVVLGATQVFLASKQSFNRMDEQASRQESLRFFADVVSLDIRSSAANKIDDTGDKVLVLEYTKRTKDPYCSSSTSDLVSVIYSYNSGAVYVNYDCGDGLVGEQAVVDGLVDADFDFISSDGYVAVDIEFAPIGAESVADKRFSFRVANRESVAR